MTYQQKAEAYVREKLPELKGFEEEDGDGFGHLDDPIQLQHWLRVLGEEKYPSIYPSVEIWSGILTAISAEENSKRVKFNLTTGQPATEADYQAFCEIVGISSK